MTTPSARLRRRLFGIDPDETRVSRRGFAVPDARMRERIEAIGAAFVEGYHAALLETRPERLAAALDRMPAELRGFGYEGAAMGLKVADFFTPWRASWREFLAGPGADHAYMVHVGAGWALARLPLSATRFLRNLDPLLRWLVVDGYGFHEGYFHGPGSLVGQQYPRRWQGYTLKAFDQGLGRSLWFVKGGEAEAIAAGIAAFPVERHADLWSGIGLAATYAGGVEAPVLSALRARAGEYHPELAQGAAFAAKARHRAGNPAPHNESACRVFCRMSVDEAASLTDRALAELSPEGETPAYEQWRQRIREAFVAGEIS